MRMRVRYSAHAEEKIRIRLIPRSSVRLVLRNPEYKFYDVACAANVSIAVVSLDSEKVGLVVAFVVDKDGIRVITVYPVRDFRGEMRRKVNSGRWVNLG